MYYRPRVRTNHHKKKLNKFILIIIAIFILFNTMLYFFDKSVLPAILSIAEVKMKNEATDIVYKTAMDIYSKDFDYKDVILVEKDNEGNISMVRADTVKLNYLSSKLITDCNSKLKDLTALGVDVPLGYMTRNSVIHNLGPNVNVKMSQLGNITSSYDSIFESAGINQTRHKIYLNVNLAVRVIVPMNTKDIDIACQIPIAETIIVGKIPNTAIELNK